MRKIVLSIVFVALVATGIVWAIGRSTNTANTSKLQVAATFYPLADAARSIGGGKVSVSNMTPPGAEPHDYEPSAKALADAQKARVFVYNGGTFEPWTERFVGDYQHVRVKASSGVPLAIGVAHTEEGEDREAHTEGDAPTDPHFWLDPVLAQQIAANIRDGLTKADPANKDYYQQRAAKYIASLGQLHQEFAAGLQHCQQQTIVASHSAFSYVAKRYGFEVEAIAGLSPEVEPSTARIAELTKHVNQEGIKYIFFERLVSARLADTIAQETGAQTLVLDPIEGLTNEDQQQGKDYFSVQRENLANLRTALACK